MERQIVLSIDGGDAGLVRRACTGRTGVADVVELRADRLRTEEVVAAVRCCAAPMIVTARSRLEGGAWDRDEGERRALYRAALDAGAMAVDVELTSDLAARLDPDDPAGLEPERVVLSVHGGPCTLEALRSRYRELEGSRARWLKLVPRAERLEDIVAVRDLLMETRGDRRRLACFATGAAGTLTRILCLAWGSWATYGSALRGAETAPGQLAVRDLAAVYRVREIGASTRFYGLLGNPVSESPSPAMHSDAYERAGLDARYLPVETSDLDAFETVRPLVPFDAVGVTRPHKEIAASRCHALDDLAAGTSAVNTLRFSGPEWSGWNTDASALRALLRGRGVSPGARAVVLGAGGTGRTAAWVLAREGARVTVVNRSEDRARRAAKALGVDSAPWSQRTRLRAEIWIQATPTPHIELPVDTGTARLVVDYVYGPRPSAAVELARAAGIDTIDGLELLAAQGADQFRRMTGSPVDPDRMRRVAEAWLADRDSYAAPPGRSG
jgi:3-dehydroquinate dehydratase/shikimate dehydrogenase